MSTNIPIVLVLWQDKNFGGSKRVFVVDDANLTSDQADGSVNFNDKASAVGVHPGPDFDFDITVSLFSDTEFKGKELVLAAGAYNNLKNFDFNDCISSVRFNPADARAPGLYINEKSQFSIEPTAAAQTISPIPAVVQLYVNHSYRTDGPLGPEIHTFHIATLVETSLDLGADFGSEFSGSAVGVKVAAGPNPTSAVHLYRETNPDTPQGHNQGGGHIDLLPLQAPFDPRQMAGTLNLSDYGFEKQTKAVKIDPLRH